MSKELFIALSRRIEDQRYKAQAQGIHVTEVWLSPDLYALVDKHGFGRIAFLRARQSAEPGIHLGHTIELP